MLRQACRGRPAGPAGSVRGVTRAPLSAALATAVVLALSACTAGQPMPTPTPTIPLAPTGDGVLRIGTLVPTSGTFAFLGAAQVAGVEIAVREINEAGGVNGVPVEVVNRDSGDAGTQTAEASFADLVAQGVDVVVGPTSSVLAQRLLPLALQARIPMISPAATYPQLSGLDDAGFLSRTIPSYGTQALALAAELAGKKVAVVAVDDPLGGSLVDALGPAVEAKGGQLVGSQLVAASGGDVAAAVTTAIAQAPDALVLSSDYTSLDLTKALISQALGAGYGAGRLWLTSQNTGDYNQAFPPGTLAGVNGVIDGIQPPEAFVARLKQSDPNLAQFRYSSEAYDAVMLAALAAVLGGDDGGATIAAWLPAASTGGIRCGSFGECLDVLTTQDDIDYEGVSGPVNLDAVGDVTGGSYGVYAYDGDNKFVLQRTVTVG